MYLLIQINVIFLYAGLPTSVLGLFSVKTRPARDLIKRGVTEQQLGALSSACKFNPLIAKLGFSPDVGIPFWAALLSLAPIMRKVPADTD